MSVPPFGLVLWGFLLLLFYWELQVAKDKMAENMRKREG